MADRIPMPRVPTARELDQGYADQVAADYLRAKATYGARAGPPGRLAEIDVMRPETVPPRATPALAVSSVPAPPPARPGVVRMFCTVCGTPHEHARRATAKAMATKCARRHQAEP